MKKTSICVMVLIVLQGFWLNMGHAEASSTPQRRFKTWTTGTRGTIETTEKIEAKRASVALAQQTQPEWKKNLAASAAKKQAASSQVAQEAAWKKNLAASAAKKQAVAKSEARALAEAKTQSTTARQATARPQSTTSRQAAAKPQSATAQLAATRAQVTKLPSVTQETQSSKASLKAAAKAKQKKNKQKQKDKANKDNKANNVTVKEKGRVTYSDGWRMKVAQQKLHRLGYLSETATGKLTSATQKALERFQKEQRLSVTGKLDDKTYRKLEWEVFSRDGIKNLSGAAVVKEAAKYKGVRYVFGGTTPKGFDCSGYVQYVFKQLHAKVTRTADTQALEGVFVTQRQLKPGDLVFFSTYEPGASHCGIYAGNGRFWNATSSKGVMLCGLQEDYWRKRYYGARRLLISNGEPSI